MPELFKIHELIIENLEKCGFEVLSLTYEEKEFKYKNVFQRLKKIWYRNILGKYSYYYGYGGYGKYGRYGRASYGTSYGQYGNYGNYGNYANSHYGNKHDDSIKR